MSKFSLLLIIISVFLFVSCQKHNAETDVSIPLTTPQSSHESKVYFAKTLAKAVEQEPLLRIYLKQEALKMFDNDYDVFYQSVKNFTLSDGHTVYEKIAKYASSKDSLDLSIQSLPLLTMYVADLPELTPENWDTDNTIPVIAVESQNQEAKEDIKAFYGKNEAFEIPHGLIPAFRTIVIKDNERVLVRNQKENISKIAEASISKISNKDVFLVENGLSFCFADEVFNGLLNMNISLHNKSITTEDRGRPTYDGSTSYTRTIYLSTVQHLIDAMKSGVEWQRDNIYYGINPSAGVNSGPVRKNIKECLTSLRFKDGPDAYDKIGKDPGSPQPINGTTIAQSWTSGTYEFRLNVLINTKNGAGAETNKTFWVKPSDIFELGYRRHEGPRESSTLYYYEPYVVSAKIYVFPTPIPIEAWNLENVSLGWKLSLIKYNPQQTYTENVQHSSEFATNFEMNIGLGEKVKVGAKFGASAKWSNSQSYSITKTSGNNVFGDGIISFDEPVILNYSIGQNNMVLYNPYELDLGAVYISIEPRKVY